MKNKKNLISIVVIIIITIATLYSLPLIKQYNDREKFIPFAGSVIDSISRLGVSGIDMTVDDTTIRTGDNGRFVFPQVSTIQGITMTHPELLRAMQILPQRSVSDTQVFFNVSMYNALISFIDHEAKGRFALMYDYLVNDIKNTITLEKWQEEYQPFFLPEDTSKQTIIVKKISFQSDYFVEDFDLRFNNIFTFEIVNNGINKSYNLRYNIEEGIWNLVP